MMHNLIFPFLLFQLFLTNCNQAQNSQNLSGPQDWPQFLGPEGSGIGFIV